MSVSSPIVTWAAVASIACLGALALAQPAQAAFGISAFDGEVLAADGSAASQAGGHPATAEAGFALNLLPDLDPILGEPLPDGALRQTRVELPPGFIGNPTVVAQCTGDQLVAADVTFGYRGCPTDSQVGVADVDTTTARNMRLAVFNMVPPPGVVASFAFFVADTTPVYLNATLRTGGDYGVTIDTPEISQALPILSTKVTLWGVPADPSHDPDRFRPEFAGPVTFPRRAFVTNPTACTPAGAGVETRIAARSWEGGQDSASFVSHDVAPNEGMPLGPTGCEHVPFDPSIDLAPTTSEPDAPTGLTVDLGFPRQGLEDPDGIAGAHLKRAEVTLPEGMSINPSAAGGLAGCSDAQLGLNDAGPARCPDASKIGTVEATSPVLGKFDENNRLMTGEDGGPLLETLSGAMYVRSQNSDDPASGEMFRVALVVANEDRGVLVKLGGQVRANPQTGQLVVTFDNNPQLPVDRLKLALKSGPRAPLATPSKCGTHTIVSRLTSWARPDGVTLTDSFEIACPAASQFSPGFGAGTTNPVGGEFSPFAVWIDRPEGQQFLSGVQVDMPKGLIAKLRGVQLCPDGVAGDGTPGVCPAGSRIGAATVGAGSGSPFSLPGDVYLTGPYKGAPYGLSVQVPAKAGPFDLGMVKVRQAIHVDPKTAELSVLSDPLPQIVKGVPARLRAVNVDIDRPAFTINPTSCAEEQVRAKLTSIDGAVHKTSSRFQVGDCQALGFKPKLAMRLSGKRQTRTGGHPALKTVLTQGKGQANIGSARVTLPRSVVLDANNSYDPKLVCGYDAALKADCPASTVIGKATANTPVLNKPLSGKVHLVQGIKFGPKGNRIRTTPSLLVKLRGEVAIDLRAKTTVDRSSRLVTTFPEVPDAPVSKFTLNINGGKEGILVVTRTRKAKIDICKSKQIADVETDGQNGKRADFATRIKTPCGARANRR